MCCSYETVVSTSRHPAHPVSVPILPPREDTCYVVTKPQHRNTTYRYNTNVVRRVDNGMTCRRTGYDRCDVQMLAIQMHALTERKNERDKETNERISLGL